MSGKNAKYHNVENDLKKECIKYDALVCCYNKNLPKENETAGQTKSRRSRIRRELNKYKKLHERSTVVYKQQEIESARLAATLTIPSSPAREKYPPKKRINNNPSPKKNNNKPPAQPTENNNNNIIDNEPMAIVNPPTANDVLPTNNVPTADVTSSSTNDAPTADDPSSNNNNSQLEFVEASWMDPRYVNIAKNATEYLIEHHGDEINIDSAKKAKLSIASPMEYNTLLLESLKGTGTIPTPTIDDPLEHSINELNKKETESIMAVCEIRRCLWSRQNDSRRVTVKSTDNRGAVKINKVASAKKKEKQRNAKVSVQLHVDARKIGLSLLPVNEMKSRNKANFKTTLREQGYVIVSETVTFDSSVYCDGKVVNNTEGLWQLQDLNNGSMVVYVDTIGIGYH